MGVVLALGSPRTAVGQQPPPEESSSSSEPSGQGSPDEGGKAADSEPSTDDEAAQESSASDDQNGDSDESSSSEAGSDGDTEESKAQTGGEPKTGESDEIEGTRYEKKELVRRARTNEDLLAEFEAKRDQAEWKRYRAKWANVPRIKSLTTIAPVPADADPDRIQNNYDEIGNLNIGPFVNQSLDLLVPVYTFGRIKALRDLADVGIDVTELKKREAQLNAVFQTKRALYSLQLSRAFEPILKEGDERIEEKLQEMQDARDFGTADFETKDLRKLQIFSTEVDTRIVDNRKLETISTSGLKYLADLEAQKLQVGRLDTEGKPRQLADFDHYLEVAKRRRPDLRQLNHALEARRLQVKLAKRQYYPNAFATAGLRVGWSTESTALQRVCRKDSPDDPRCENTDDLWARPDSDPLNRFSIRVGVGLRWKFNFIGQHGKLKERKAQLRALQAQQQRALGGIKIEIRKKYSDAYDQRKKIEITDRRLRAARRWRDQMGLTMQSAAGQDLDDLEDAIDPLKAYYKAKAKALEARYRYAVARAALAQAVGVQNLEQVEPENLSEDEGEGTSSDDSTSSSGE